MTGEARRVAVVLGTRPEIIKLAPIVELLGEHAYVIYTGQHYDSNMSEIFFDQIGMRNPDIELGIGGVERASQISGALEAIASVLTPSMFSSIVVQGDTNSTLAGALAANCRGVPVVHVEAGLRSYDRAMPEEHNRVMTDHISDVLLAPTETSASNLAREGIVQGVAITGNTVVEAVERVLPHDLERREILGTMGLEDARFVLATIHRPENVDDLDRLRLVLSQLDALGERVVLPIHPRTRERVRSADLSHLMSGFNVVPPLGYREFLALAKECWCLVSDSGGVQEEVAVLRRPVAVLRRSTERPEVLGTFAELVSNPTDLADAVKDLTSPERARAILAAPNPYGDGTAAAKSILAMTDLGYIDRTHLRGVSSA